MLDTRVTDTDARSYCDLSSSKVLENAGKIKKDDYLTPCLTRRRGFVFLLYSVDGVAGKETKSFERCIALLLSRKGDCPFSDMVGYMRRHMGLAIICHNTTLLRGSPSKYRRGPEIKNTADYEAVQESNHNT